MSSPRVNIQYSVSVEDLPDEISRLVTKATHLQMQMSEECGQLNTADPDTLWSAAYVGDIQNWRAYLVEIDHTLKDVENLVKSYLSQMGSSAHTAVENTPTPSPSLPLKGLPLPSPGDLDHLIENFQERIESPREEGHEITPEASP